jgi:hypothetical protein
MSVGSQQDNSPKKAELLIAGVCNGDLAGSVDEVNTKS